ncbi:MAG: hypothetical protein Q9221_006623 [Calogaya cf. arnoldii]
MSATASPSFTPPKPKSSTDSGRNQQKARPRSGLSQSEEDGQRETLEPPRQDTSLSSSSRSVHSQASFDFSKLDRLDDSINTPGIVRSAASNFSQQGFPTLPDEKGFSIQIGSELFKLSGASIMSDVPRLQTQLFESEIFVEVGNEHFRVPRDIFSAPGDTPNYFTLGFTVFFTSPGDVFPGLNPKGLLRPPGIQPPRIPNRSPQIFSDLLHTLRGYPLTIKNEDHRNQLLKDARYYNLRGLEQKLIPHDITFNLEQRMTEIVIRLQDLKPSQISAVYDRKSLQNDDGPTHQRTPGYVRYARPFISEPHHALILEICASTATEPILLDLVTKRIAVFGNTRSRITALFQTIANKLSLPTTVPLGLLMGEGDTPEIKGKGPGSTGLSEEKIMADIGPEACVTVDGEEWIDRDVGGFGDSHAAPFEIEDFAETMVHWPHTTLQLDENPSTKRSLGSPSDDHLTKRRREGDNQGKRLIWTVDKSQWRLRLQSKLHTENETDAQEGGGMEIVMVAVKIEATSGEKARNTQRRFLS